MDNDINRSQVRSRYLKYILAGLAAFIILILTGTALYYRSRSYVATVGSEKVTRAEYTFFLNISKNQVLERLGYTIDPESFNAETFWNTKYGSETYLDITKKEALDAVKGLKVEYIKSREEKITLGKDDLDKIDKLLQEDAKGRIDGGSSKINDYYKDMYGVTFDQLRSIYKQISLAHKLKTKVTRDYKFDEADIRDYYEKNPEKYMNTEFRRDGEEAVWARHILIKTFEGNDVNKKVPPDKVNEARKTAEGLLERLKKGEDFASLAREISQDEASASNGGEYIFVRNQMAKPFEEAAFDKLQPGMTSEVVQTDFGFHIIKLEEKIPEDKPVSYRAAREYHEFGLGAQTLIDNRYQAILDGWKKQYEIKINKAVYDDIE